MDVLMEFICHNTVRKGKFKTGEQFRAASFGVCRVLEVIEDDRRESTEVIAWRPKYVDAYPSANTPKVVELAELFQILFEEDYLENKIRKVDVTDEA